MDTYSSRRMQVRSSRWKQARDANGCGDGYHSVFRSFSNAGLVARGGTRKLRFSSGRYCNFGRGTSTVVGSVIQVERAMPTSPPPVTNHTYHRTLLRPSYIRLLATALVLLSNLETTSWVPVSAPCSRTPASPLAAFALPVGRVEWDPCGLPLGKPLYRPP